MSRTTIEFVGKYLLKEHYWVTKMQRAQPRYGMVSIGDGENAVTRSSCVEINGFCLEKHKPVLSFSHFKNWRKRYQAFSYPLCFASTPVGGSRHNLLNIPRNRCLFIVQETPDWKCMNISSVYRVWITICLFKTYKVCKS
jgi:hypothetical protein